MLYGIAFIFRLMVNDVEMIDVNAVAVDVINETDVMAETVVVTIMVVTIIRILEVKA